MTPTDPVVTPKVVFFRPTRTDLPAFVATHLSEHVKCLRQWFDVALVIDDVDFDEVCDREQPDLVIFESGVYSRPGRRIRNTDRHPLVPRVGFLDADPYCLTRSVFLSDMDEWGVDTFFSIGVTAAAHTPAIADRLFAWPNFADKAVFHSYPGDMTTSVLLAGSRRPNYPWRVMVDKALAERFPVRSLPHSGWFDRAAAAGMPTGEQWARSLSAAQIVPTCGTIADDLVRKHFEVPASGALLVTEQTAAVVAAGFVDMQNCVFAEPSDVVDKVEYLLSHPNELEAIAAAGQELAHSRHDIAHRDQILQWYRLEIQRGLGQRIVQPDLFGPLRLTDEDRGAPVSVIVPPTRDIRELRAAQGLLAAGQLSAAADGFAEVLNQHLEPEAGLGLARTRLREGKPTEARRQVWSLIDRELGEHGARRPDAVEWAFYLRALLAEGATAEAMARRVEFRTLAHPEFQRMHHVLSLLADAPDGEVGGDGLRSVHVIPETTWEDWRADVLADLRACGQGELASRIERFASFQPVHAGARASRVEERVQTSAAGHARRRGIRRIASGVVRRIRRTRVAPIPDDSLFSHLADDTIDVVVSVLVRDRQASEAIERLVANDPTDTALVRVGRDTTAPPSNSPGNAVGHRSGASRSLLARLPSLGRAVVIAGPDGGGYLAVGDLSATEILVLLDPRAPAHAGLQRDLAECVDWGMAEDALHVDLAGALSPFGGLEVWRRVSTGGTP